MSDMLNSGSSTLPNGRALIRRASTNPSVLGGSVKSTKSVRWMLLLVLISCYVDFTPLALAQQRYCGATLDQALVIACKSGFNSLPLKPVMVAGATALGKRKADDVNAILGPKLQDTHDYLSISGVEMAGRLPYAMHENHLIQTRRRRARGIYEECCLNKCTFYEIAAYCLTA